MVPLTAVIIAKNEADRITACLQSLSGWIQDIVVVLNDCTDRTREIAESFHARIIEHTWEGYAQQRNIGTQYANTQWIFRIDADEVVSPELRTAIEAFFANSSHTRYNACYCYRINRFLGQWLKMNDHQLILFNKSHAHWEGVVHERLCFSGPAQTLFGPLFHYTERDVAHTLQKNIHYAHLKATELTQRYSKKRLAFNLITYPWHAFIKSYFQQRCYRNGIAGFYVASLSAIYVFFKYLFAIELKHNHD